MRSTWVLVADSSKARIFQSETPLVIKEIEGFSHIEGRLHAQELTSDLPGKDSGVSGAGGHAYEGKVGPKEQEVINFAKSLAAHLEDARNNKKFEQLMIVAEPSFLGSLRKQLSNSCKQAIGFELDKSLTSHDVEDIRKHLPERL